MNPKRVDGSKTLKLIGQKSYMYRIYDLKVRVHLVPNGRLLLSTVEIAAPWLVDQQNLEAFHQAGLFCAVLGNLGCPVT